MLKDLKTIGILLLVLFVFGVIADLTYSGEGQEAAAVKTVPVSGRTVDSTKLVPTMFVPSGIKPSAPTWNQYVKEANKQPTLNSTFQAKPKAK